MLALVINAPVPPVIVKTLEVDSVRLPKDVTPVPPWFTAIVVPAQVPLVMVPTDANDDAVVKALKVVRVPFVVAERTVALCVPVTSPLNEPVKLPDVAAFRFATCVVEATTRGGVQVAIVENNYVPCTVEDA